MARPAFTHRGPHAGRDMFATSLDDQGLLEKVDSLVVQLFGSLGATGRGHGSDNAVLGGLAGDVPETAVPDELVNRVKTISETRRLMLLGKHEIDFDLSTHLLFSGVTLKFHSNGLRFTAANAAGSELHKKTYYSVGGGFVVDERAAGSTDRTGRNGTPLPFFFNGKSTSGTMRGTRAFNQHFDA